MRALDSLCSHRPPWPPSCDSSATHQCSLFHSLTRNVVSEHNPGSYYVSPQYDCENDLVMHKCHFYETVVEMNEKLPPFVCSVAPADKLIRHNSANTFAWFPSEEQQISRTLLLFPCFSVPPSSPRPPTPHTLSLTVYSDLSLSGAVYLSAIENDYQTQRSETSFRDSLFGSAALSMLLFPCDRLNEIMSFLSVQVGMQPD